MTDEQARKGNRKDREAAALRANLQRRKAQARGRRGRTEPAANATESPPSGANADAKDTEGPSR